MGRWILLIAAWLACTPAAGDERKTEPGSPLAPFVEFLRAHRLPSAKDYILSRFESHDIVVFSERDHRDVTQYELLLAVVADPRFRGHVYTEVGAANQHTRINAFLRTRATTPEAKQRELLAVYRDLSFVTVWEKTSYYRLLSTLFDLNQGRRDEDKILVFPLDVRFDWNDQQCHAQVKAMYDFSPNSPIDRNAVMGRHFVAFYERARKDNPSRSKALVIQNTYHGYIRIPAYRPLPTRPDVYSAGEYIYKTYPDRTTNVYINYMKSGDGTELSNDGLLDAAFQATGVDDVGFTLAGTPFGEAPFDLYDFGPDYAPARFETIFDGMVFYRPLSAMKLSVGIADVFPEAYEAEYFRRKALINGIGIEEARTRYADALREVNTVHESTLDAEERASLHRQIARWLD